MDSAKLEALLKKYWACETTLEEEQELRTWFRQADIPEQWRETAALFHYFDAQKGKELPRSFDAAVEKKLAVKSRPAAGKVRNLVFNAMRIAAGVAVLVAATYLVRQEIRKEDPVALEDTYTDPQQAFEETKKALQMISKGFGTAEQQAKRINMFNEAQEKVQTSTKEETEL
jgi:hypothetical protein